MKDKDDLFESEEMKILEEARETQRHEGFISDLFLGEASFDYVRPFPEQSSEDKQKADEFIERLRKFLVEKVDPNAIDRDGEILDDVIQGLKDLGVFGLKIPREYGGHGFSQSNYRRIFQMVGSRCANIVALIAPPNSIGASVPILKFGTEEQKNKYLPQLAKGKISAFGLTENEAGSDPSRIKAMAQRVYNEKGEHIGYKLNGRKVWITGSVKDDGVPLGEYVVVVAKTKDDPKMSKKKLGLSTLFISSDLVGYTTPHRTRFGGLKAIYNGVLEFDNIFVPKENLIGPEGRGFKVADQSLAVGRLTIVSSCVGGLKQSLQIARWWCKKRVQWRQSIGRHEATGSRLVKIAYLTMVTDALAQYCAKLVDDHKDVRIPAMSAKVIATNHLWEALDNLMQIRAGSGYENYYSLKNRGEIAVGVERMWRDSRVNSIFEGENTLLSLASGREGTDDYKQKASALMEGDSKARLSAGLWMSKQLSKSFKRRLGSSHETFIYNQSKLLTYQLLRVGEKYRMTGLQKKQLVVGQLVARVYNLFLMALVLSYAEARNDKPLAKELADYFCLTVREEMTGAKWTTDWLLNGSHGRVDELAKRLMEGEAKWLEEGIISALEQEGVEI